MLEKDLCRDPCPIDPDATLKQWLQTRSIVNRIYVNDKAIFYHIKIDDWIFIIRPKMKKKQLTLIVVTAIRFLYGKRRNQPKYRKKRAEEKRGWKAKAREMY